MIIKNVQDASAVYNHRLSWRKERLEFMKTRLITAFVGAMVFLAILFAPPVVFQAAVVVLAGVATYEAYSVTGIAKKIPLAVTGAFGVLWCALLGCMQLGSTPLVEEMLILCMTLHVGVLLAILVFCHKNVKLDDVSKAFFMAVFIGLLYSFLIPLREGKEGIFLVLVLFVGTWCGDGGAYFIGVRYGKRKLAPTLSPKKTVEGAYGGVLGSVLGLIVLALIINIGLKTPINICGFIVAGIGCALLGPVADIATSAIKREYNVKDFGNLFPGHGGVLDRFDSILLTAPFVYFVDKIFHLVG